MKLIIAGIMIKNIFILESRPKMINKFITFVEKELHRRANAVYYPEKGIVMLTWDRKYLYYFYEKEIEDNLKDCCSTAAVIVKEIS